MLSNGKLRKSNSGFTLVELIVTIVLMVIVGGAITSFVVVAQRNYNYGVADTDLQYEAQLLSNRMQDLVIDTAKGISYEYSGKLASGEASEGLILDDSLIGSDVDVVETKNLYVYDSDKYYRLEWRTDTHEIWYSEYKPDNTETLTAGPELLAEYVTAFSVDLRELAAKRTVKYTITFTKEGSGKEYTTTHKIKLRNEALVNTAIDAIYTPGPVEITPTGITVYVEKDKMWPTETAQVAATVTSDSGLMPSQTVTWSVEGNTDSNTAITANLLTYGVNEAGSTVESGSNYVTVKAVQGSLQATAVVGVRRINGLSSNVYTTKSGTIEAIPGNKLMEGDKQVTVELPVSAFSGAHISDLLTSNVKNNISNMGGITIAVTQGAEYVDIKTKDEENGKLVFDVKDDIDYTTNPEPKVVEVTISCNRAGFTDVKTVQRFTVAEKNLQPITPGVWDRQGKIKIDTTQIPEDKREWQGGVPGNIGVHVEFYRKDGSQINSFDLSNNGGHPDDQHYDRNAGKYYMDVNGYVRLYYSAYDYFSVELMLLPKFAYSNETYLSADDWNDAVDYIMLTVKYGNSLQYACEPVKMTINPVSFLYNETPYGDKDTWKDEYTAYVAPGYYPYFDIWSWEWKYVNRQTVKVYYMLDEGWSDDNKDYQVKTDRFICSMNGNRYVTINHEEKEINDYVTVDSGSDDMGSYVTFTMDNSFINLFKTNTIDIVYEGKQNEPIKGCDGIIHFTLVGEDQENIVLQFEKDGQEHTLSSPNTMYCPPEVINWAKEQNGTYYYYISDTERFEYQYNSKQSADCITYQKLERTWVGGLGGHWIESWEYTWLYGNSNEKIVWLSYKDNKWQYDGVLTKKK